MKVALQRPHVAQPQRSSVLAYVREREPIPKPSALERVRGAGYGAVAPLRHLIEIVAVGAVTAVVGAPEPVVLLATGCAAAGCSLVGMLSEAFRPTRAAQQPVDVVVPTVAATREAFVAPVADVTPPGRIDPITWLRQSELARATCFTGVGSALTAGALTALGLPLAWQLVLVGGLGLAAVGLVATRNLTPEAP